MNAELRIEADDVDEVILSAAEMLQPVLTFSVSENQEWYPLRLIRSERDALIAPSGFLPTVLSCLRSAFDVRVVDARSESPSPEPLDLLIPLRGDQDAAVQRFTRIGQGVIKAAPGAGKGNMLAACVAAVPVRWGVFAPTNELVDDLHARLRSVAGIDAGLVSASRVDVRDVTVFSYSKLVAMQEKEPERVARLMARLDAIAVDECHTACAKERFKLLSMCTNARWRVGFSATPFARRDNLHVLVRGLLGPVIHETTYTDVAEAGNVASVTVEMVVFKHLVPQERRSYTDLYIANIQNNEERNKLICDMALAAPKPCMVFTTYTNHGKQLEKMLRRKVSCTFAYGDMSKEMRADVIKAAKNGSIDVIIASKVFDTGIDIPNLATVISADCGAAATKAVQKVGRGMRKTQDKRHFTVYDVYDVGFRNSAGKPAIFERQALDRMKAYANESYEVKVSRWNERTNSTVPYDQ